MFSLSNILPVPFKEKGALKTWDIKQGYDIVCCETSGSTGGSGGLSDTLLQSILDELEIQNAAVNATSFTTAINGSIPAGVQSYTVINLGVDPSNPASAVNSMFVDGIEYNSKFVRYGNSTDTSQVLVDAVPYIPNGNTLAIIYNTPV